MNRKALYALLGLPVIAFILFLVVVPGETRAAFFSDFGFRIAELLGREQKFSDEAGLRSEHPEEYGGGEAASPYATGDVEELGDELSEDVGEVESAGVSAEVTSGDSESADVDAEVSTTSE